MSSIESESDNDYLFEEQRAHAFSFNECIDAIKALHDAAPVGTKAKNYYFTMWSAMQVQQHALYENMRLTLQCRQLSNRVNILERLLLMMVEKNADLSVELVTHRIIDSLKEKSPKVVQ